LLFIAGCAAAPRSKVEHPEPKGLKAILAYEREASNLSVEKAYFFEDTLYIRQKAGQSVIYSRGSKEAIRIKRSDESKVQDAPESDFIIHLDNHSKNPWKDFPENTGELSLKSGADWIDLMKILLTPIIPEDAKSGILIDFWTEVEIFFWYDIERNKYASSLLQEKPPGIEIKKAYSFSGILNQNWDVIEKHLKENSNAKGGFLFETAAGKEVNPYSFPYFYMDLDRKQLMAVQLLPDETANKLYFVGNYHHQLSHIVRSSLGIITRPFTTANRSVFIVVDYITDTIRPNSLSRIAKKPIPELNGGSGMDLAEFERELDKHTSSELSRGTMDFLVQGDMFFPRLIDAMLAAQRSIDICVFIFDVDDYALKIADILKEKSRTLKVRGLFDGLPTIGAVSKSPQYIPKGFRNPLSINRYLRANSNVKARLRPNILFSLDHTKVILIDNDRAFIGGMNIGREYRYEWHDLMMELKGPVVDILQKRFDWAWAFSGFGGDFAAAYRALAGTRNKKRDTSGCYPIRILYTRPGGSDIFLSQRLAAKRARRRIFIENPYFADSHIIYELARARRRGVDVRVILPVKNNWGIMNYNNIVTANILLANGIRVYLYPGMTHMKAAVYDGWACVGSANFDRASFRLNRELNIATSHQEAVQELLDEVFTPDFALSRELTKPYPEKWHYYFLKAFASHL
jgi:cardiolipin synthase